jgi:hypothetical protein
MRGFLLAAFSTLLLASMGTNAAESADAILARVAQTYATFRSYTDRGVVLRYLSPDAPPNETSFETAFARPALFRFAFVSHHPYPPLRHIAWPAVIWSDGVDSYSRYDYGLGPPQTTNVGSLEMAIAGATGVSGGAALTVPRLLMPEINSFSIADLTSSTVIGVESVEGESCYHLVGEAPRIGPIHVWIGTKSALLRKVQERFGDIRQEEIRRDIHVNEEVPPAKFLP